jgi:hypothetical protein
MGPTQRRLRALPWRSIVLVLIVGHVVGWGAFWWLNGGKRLFFPRKFATVEAGFYRAGQIHRRLIEDVLVEHEIDLVVDLARDKPGDENAVAEKEIAARLGIPLLPLHRLSGSGSGEIEQYVDALAAVVEAREANQNVLVHCAAGSERTGTLVALYRLLYQDWEGPRAYEEYLSFRKRMPEEPKVSRYVNEHLADIAAALSARGLLDAVPELPPGFGPAAASARPPVGALD